MGYRQKLHVDEAELREPLSAMLGWNVRDIEAEYQRHGYSGGVQRLTLTGPGGTQSVVLKPMRSPHEYRFYCDVLEPLALDSPTMYGSLAHGATTFTVMAYVPHEPPDWNDPSKYVRAIDWLLYKDRVAHEHLDAIRCLDYIPAFELGLEASVELLLRACEERLDPLLSATFGAALKDGTDKLRALSPALRCGPQTVVHNDFQMLNLLFHGSELYVIDWTFPMIGATSIDLAKIVHVAPERLQAAMIERYGAGGSLHAESLAAARVHVDLAMLAWIVRALNDGQGRAVHRPKFEQIVGGLRAFLER